MNTKLYNKVKSVRSTTSVTRWLMLVISCLAFTWGVQAQTTVTIGTGGTSIGGTTNGRPIYRSSATSSFNFSQSVMMLTAGQLSAAGIVPGSTINSIAWFKNDGAQMNGTRTASWQVHLKSTSNTDLVSVASQTYAAWSASATLGYSNSSIAAGFFPASAGFVTLTLSSPFQYNGGSLEIGSNWSINAGTGNPTTGAFTWTADATAGVQAVGTSSSATITAALGTQLSNSFRTQINFTSPPPCNATPTPGNTTGPSTFCPASNFTLGIQNIPAASGISYQWESSPDGSTWTPVNGATSSSLTTNQTVATYYRCQVTCAGNGTQASNPLLVNVSNFLSCYCSSTATSPDDEEILNVTFGTLNNSSTCTSFGNAVAGSVLKQYSDYRGANGITIPQVMQGTSVSYSVQVGTCGGNFTNRVAIYIDLNRNGLLTDAGEQLVLSNAVAGPNTVSGSINIPLTASVGQTLMRIISNETSGAVPACGGYSWGETEDYIIEITQTTNCTGAPTPGNAVSSNNNPCPSANFTLSYSGYQSSGNQTWQWESSPDGNTWTPINGAINPTLTTNQTVATYYRVVVTCTTVNQSATSNPIFVDVNGFLNCYCSSGATTVDDEEILNVTFGTLNNSSTCSSFGNAVAGSVLNQYSNYRGASGINVPQILQAATVNYSVQVGTCGGNWNNRVAIYIDLNRNGLLTDAGEQIVLSTPVNGPNTVTGTFTMPVTATPGVTLMRVISNETTGAVPACGGFSWGETEDYFIEIMAAPQCSGNPTQANTVTSMGSVCSGSNFTLSIDQVYAVLGMSYQWQSSPDNSTWSNVTNATNTTLTTSQTAQTYYRCIVTCANGGGTMTSTPVVVNLQSFLNCYCASTATNTADEEILNVTFGSLNNSSTCTNNNNAGAGSVLNMYSNYRGVVTPPQVTQGDIVPFSVQVGTCGGNFNNRTAIFIDFNRNGVLTDAGEQVLLSNVVSGPNTVSGNITIPNNADIGNTLLRVVTVETSGTITPCGTYSWGETEDYFIQILAPVPCTNPPVAGSINGPSTFNYLTQTANYTAPGASGTIIWQYSSTGGAPWTNFGNGSPVQFNPGTVGTYTLRYFVTRPPQSCVADTVATPITVTVTEPTGNSIANPFIIGSMPYNSSQNVQNFSNAVSTRAGKDVVYRLTVPTTCADSIYINLCATDFDSYLNVLAANGTTVVNFNDDSPICGGFGSYLAFKVGTGTGELNPGAVYYIIVEPWSSSPLPNTVGNFTLRVQNIINGFKLAMPTPTISQCGGSVVLAPTVQGVTNYAWTRNGSVISGNVPTRTVNLSGNWKVVGTNAQGCQLVDSTLVTIIPSIPVNPSYNTGFESTNQGWAVGGTLSTWALGTPAKGILNAAQQGTNSWCTGLSTGKNLSENSNIESPCFDFASFTTDTPVISFWYFSQMTGNDVLNLQMAIGNGAFSTIASFNNANNTTRWTYYQAQLPVAAKGAPSVKFRFVFSGDAFSASQGVCIDNLSFGPPVTPVVAPTTKIQNADCGRTDFALVPVQLYTTATSIIGLPGVDAYIVNFYSNAATTNLASSRVQNGRTIVFSTFNGLNWNTNYWVRIRAVKGGIAGPEGDTCRIGFIPLPTAPSIPTTQLQTQSCGRINFKQTNTLFANLVNGATSYVFNFYTNAAGTNLYATITRPTLTLPGNNILPSLAQGTDYWVGVSACIGNVCGAQGALCKISTEPAPPRFSANSDLFSLSLYPNPFATNANLIVNSDKDETVIINVYDMVGRLVFNNRVAANAIVQVGETLQPGIYNIVAIRASGATTQTRMFKSEK